MCRDAESQGEPARPWTVSIVSGSFGAGHDAAAREIRACLAEHGIRADIHDIVDLLPPGLGRALKAVYLRQLRSVPASWGWLLRRLDGTGEGGPSRLTRLIATVTAAASRRIIDDVARGADAIVSTHPLASQSLGQLRLRGLVTQPVFTYLTDLSVHRLWVHNGVSAHLALHDVAAVDARDHGARIVHVVRPAVARSLREVAPIHAGRAMLRVRFGLPATGRLCLITGGSEGVGELAETAADVAACSDLHPVVLCGHNDHLRRRLEHRADVTALGWVCDMPSLFAAVDVVVQNAGGSTSLEALAAGLPVVSYRCIPGHGETNAAALDRAGLAPWVRRPADLCEALRTVTDGQTPTMQDATRLLRASRCVGATVSALVEAG